MGALIGTSLSPQTPYAFVKVNVCHASGCAATRFGKKRGPCNCGGEGLMRELAEQAGAVYDFQGGAEDHVQMRRKVEPGWLESIRCAPEHVEAAKAEGWELL